MSDKTRTGWVYVLVNESIADQVKVGFTSGHPEDRAKELRTSGVPTPYQVATAFLFTDKAKQIEQRAHLLMKDCRVSSDREFFRSDARSAAHIIRLAAKQLDQTPRAIEPVLLTPEEIAEKEKQEVERENFWKGVEENERRQRQAAEAAQRQRRKAEEKERQELLRQQEWEREIRLEEMEKKKEKLWSKISAGIFIGGWVIVILGFMWTCSR